jgi:hypothetical protein
MTTKATGKIGEIRLGLLDKGDARDLERLAQRDSSAVPNGSVLGAWVDGQLLAALSVKSGHAVADPFVRTQELVELLDERAAQVRGSRRGRLGRIFGGHNKRARAALPASPPGAGGKLLTLPQRAL